MVLKSKVRYYSKAGFEFMPMKCFGLKKCLKEFNLAHADIAKGISHLEKLELWTYDLRHGWQLYLCIDENDSQV